MPEHVFDRIISESWQDAEIRKPPEGDVVVAWDGIGMFFATWADMPDVGLVWSRVYGTPDWHADRWQTDSAEWDDMEVVAWRKLPTPPSST